MAATEAEGNVRRVYISDSPVLDDQIEYNYVSSDVEDDIIDSGTKIKGRQKTPAAPNHITNGPESVTVMAPAQDSGPLTEEDELAREAQYQKELQDRLEKVTVEEE